MRSYSGAELCILLLYALPGETPLRESLFRRLSRAYDVLGAQESRDGELHRDELLRLGCTAEEADAVLARLSQRNVLGQYLMKLGMQGIEVITRISPEYPQRLRDVLGLNAPLVTTASFRALSSKTVRPLRRTATRIIILVSSE